MLHRPRGAARSIVFAFLALALAGAPALAVGPAVAPGTEPAEAIVPRAQEPGDAAGYHLPFESGIEVPIHQGWHSYFSHNGEAAYAYDFGLHEGTPVLAAAAGIVSYVHSGETACGGPALLMHANYVTIDHPDGSATHYGHLATVDVEVGQVVAAGDVIATSGKTGYTGCQPHLHFTRQEQGGPVTASVPVYFVGYPDAPLRDGATITRPTPACDAADALDSREAAVTVLPEPAPPGASKKARKRAAAAMAAAQAAARAALERQAPLGAFCGAYFDGRFEGRALFTRTHDVLSFDWSAEAPGGYWLDAPVDGFSARWSGRFTFPSAGTYTIGVIASDGIRIAVDGDVILDRWEDHPAAGEIVLRQALSAGIHRIDVEHYSADGQGRLKVGWGRIFGDD